MVFSGWWSECTITFYLQLQILVELSACFFDGQWEHKADFSSRQCGAGEIQSMPILQQCSSQSRTTGVYLQHTWFTLLALLKAVSCCDTGQRWGWAWTGDIGVHRDVLEEGWGGGGKVPKSVWTFSKASTIMVSPQKQAYGKHQTGWDYSLLPSQQQLRQYHTLLYYHC